ncbi:MAG: symbB [Bacteroidetes bacterium]|nr:symbB [Bacteroidota bacterium]
MQQHIDPQNSGTTLIAEGSSFSVFKFFSIFFGGIVSLVLILPVPWMGTIIAVGLAWDQLWLRLRDTAAALRIGDVLHRMAAWLASHIMRDERNAPYLYTMVGVGLWTPVLFWGCFFWQVFAGYQVAWYIQVIVAFAYNVLMMGPYFRFFSNIATLIHKEGHDTRGLFKKPHAWLNNVFGWWLGIFYGHIPETYPLGHQRIHHKYDNGPGDVTCTLDLDRSDPLQWFIYLRRFALYWTGISVLAYFIGKRQWKPAGRMALGMVCFYGLVIALMVVNPWFGFAYLLLPHLTVIIYLAAINYIWHTFCDPVDQDNAFVNSVTILDGHYNVFNEDFHVTHHHHPQMHWTKMADDYYKNVEKYKANMASTFRDTQEFEMFVWLMMGRFDLLASHYVDLTGKLSQEEIIALLKYRMQPITVFQTETAEAA